MHSGIYSNASRIYSGGPAIWWIYSAGTRIYSGGSGLHFSASGICFGAHDIFFGPGYIPGPLLGTLRLMHTGRDVNFFNTLWSPCLGMCNDGYSIVMESSDTHTHGDDHVSEDVVQTLRTARDMSLSTRNMLKLERQCTQRELVEGRCKLPPCVDAALEVSRVVSRQVADVCPLVEVVQSQLTLSEACGTCSVT